MSPRDRLERLLAPALPAALEQFVDKRVHRALAAMPDTDEQGRADRSDVP